MRSRVMVVMRKTLSAGMLWILAGSVSAQQTYPAKAIRFIVPYTTGGSSDVLARLVGQKLAEILGQTLVIENRAGGNTVIGTDAVAKSPPDGYTILQTGLPHVIIPLLFPTPFDAIKDFAAVATVVSTEYVLVLHPSLPANNLQEFIALARTKPGQLNYASSGSGGVQHLAGELFSMLAGVKLQHIPYKGGAQVVTDLMGGQVQLAFTNPANVISYLKSGRLKAIAIGGANRLPALPQVPTFMEAGLPAYDAKSWQGILAPAGTPRAIIDRLSTEIGKILAMPDIREKIISQGVDPFISTPEQFTTLMRADMAKYGKIIKLANIKME